VISDTLIEDAARRLARARRLAVLTGAGVSRESGIPTFRDPQEGLWARYDPMDLATQEGYLRNPPLVWQWYEYRFGMVEQASPNPGHRAIAELERLLPHVTVITQNIDGLHQAAGSTDVVELHGSIRRFKCVNGNHTGFSRSDFADQSEVPPHCPRCGELLRPEVVWFGEMLPEAALARAFQESRRCDAMLVVGTSGEVQPAASLPYYAAQAGASVIDVNPNRDEIAALADVYLPGPGGEVLPQMAAAVRRLLALGRDQRDLADKEEDHG
jgi:NAD-dependent deacetylase